MDLNALPASSSRGFVRVKKYLSDDLLLFVGRDGMIVVEQEALMPKKRVPAYEESVWSVPQQ